MTVMNYSFISRFSCFALTLILSIGLMSCGGAKKEQRFGEWTEFPQVNFAIPPFARYLKDVKICLDPGHGGDAHLPNYKRGPTGLREAEVNLRVAFYLSEFLQEAGAIVFMTRTDDSFVSIPDRSALANQNAVNFFISIHHNQLSNPATNYTSTWYHRDADDSLSSLDFARYVQQGVAEALRLPRIPSTGLYSDQLVVSSGFGVLRLTKSTAILCEASFFSNPEEEERLRDPEYNRREAYGYFLGIARYVASGFPKGVLIAPSPESAVETKTPRIEIRVMDGLHERGAWMLERQQVFSNSIRVKLDGVVVPHQYLRDKDVVVVTPKEPLSNGIHTVETSLVNYYGNHNLPDTQSFKIAPSAARLKLKAWTKTIPPNRSNKAEGASYVGITVTALDKDGLPIADDEPIHAQTSLGSLAQATQLSKNGMAKFYLYAGPSGKARVEFAYKRKRNRISIRFGKIRGGIVQGAVRVNTNEDVLADATIRLVGRKNRTAKTDPNGHFFFQRVSPGDGMLHVSKAGYYNRKFPTKAESSKAQIINPELHPIADLAFIGKVFVLDARYGGPKRGTVWTRASDGDYHAADLNLAVVKSLKEMLELAGATVYLIREQDESLSVEKRVAAVNAVKREGYYLRIDHGTWIGGDASVIATSYPGNLVTGDYLEAILEAFNTVLFETPIETVGDRDSPEIKSTNKPALALEIRTINHPSLDDPPDSPALIAKTAYAIFLGTSQFLKERKGWVTQLLHGKLEIQVVDSTSQQPVDGASVILDGTFPLITDQAGQVIFRNIQHRTYRVAVQATGFADQEIGADTASGLSVVNLERLPLASVRPSGLNATLLTPNVCPVSVRLFIPVTASHRRMVSSSLPLATVRPSGLKATLVTLRVCPVSRATSVPVCAP
jgi:N-acetylmuramoyl-L-alanine amidase